VNNAVNTVATKIDHATIALGVQIVVAAVFVLLMVITHALGLLGISRLLKLKESRLERQKMDFRGLLLVALTGVLLFLIHILEIVVFALFYLKVDPHMDDIADALYYSASAYATLGTPDARIPSEWQLIGALEALIGFVLIGWSTAFVARIMTKLQA
jgi:amino acid transporter